MRVDMTPRYAVVVGGGDAFVDKESRSVLEGASFIVAADAGAYLLLRLGIVPHVVLGDFDSCDLAVVEEFRARGSKVITLQRDKDNTDTEVALDLVSCEGLRQAIVLGALGGRRPEHSIANLFLIESFAQKGLDVVLMHEDTTVFGLGGRDRRERYRRFRGETGDWVSIFPVTGVVTGVTTSGLRFPLSGAVLTRGTTLGTSNEMDGREAAVAVDQGYLLIAVTGRSHLLG